MAATCQYRVFLYDIKINTGDFEDATVIHHSAGATNSAFADIILEGGATHAAGGKQNLEQLHRIEWSSHVHGVRQKLYTLLGVEH